MIEIQRRRACVNIRVPIDAAGIWQAILFVAGGDEFKITDVAAECDAPVAVIRDYVDRLKRAGVVAQIGTRGGVFKLVSQPKTAPPSRPDQQLLWNAIRRLKAFTLSEAVYWGETDVRISKPFARRYLQHLVAAGYLTEGPRVGDDQEVVYRIKPKMDTGPLAPEMIKLPIMVYDRNAGRVLADVDAEECAA